MFEGLGHDAFVRSRVALATALFEDEFLGNEVV